MILLATIINEFENSFFRQYKKGSPLYCTPMPEILRTTLTFMSSCPGQA